jgi:hypothetical protein
VALGRLHHRSYCRVALMYGYPRKILTTASTPSSPALSTTTGVAPTTTPRGLRRHRPRHIIISYWPLRVQLAAIGRRRTSFNVHEDSPLSPKEPVPALPPPPIPEVGTTSTNPHASVAPPLI